LEHYVDGLYAERSPEATIQRERVVFVEVDAHIGDSNRKRSPTRVTVGRAER
jgi:hypothetical protein